MPGAIHRPSQLREYATFRDSAEDRASKSSQDRLLAHLGGSDSI
jgi:hypothetical protein